MAMSPRFGGAASVLMRKPRAYTEVYNDLDDEVVGLFKLLREPASAARLADLLALTPYARVEFVESYEASSDPLEAARRLVVRSYMGHGASGVAGMTTGFRANSNASHTTPARDWSNYPAQLSVFARRLSRGRHRASAGDGGDGRA